MRFSPQRFVLTITLAVIVPGRALEAESTRPQNTVLVELFTSEGCSSCPPADRLLTELARHPTAEGVRVVPLSFHVDYWNYLGWQDPYSSPDFSRRQRRRSTRLSDGRVYTPQMIVDGKWAFVGSDERAALRAIQEAARSPKARLDLSLQPRDGGRLEVTWRFTPASPIESQALRLYVAMVEDGLSSAVTRGENRGRTLEHTGVVRRMVDAGKCDGAARARHRVILDFEDEWDRSQLSVVAWAQDWESGAVRGVARAKVLEYIAGEAESSIDDRRELPVMTDVSSATARPDAPSTARDEGNELSTLMMGYQEGEVAAFERLYALLAPPLRSYLASLTWSVERAEDLLQDTFLQLHRARHTYIPPRPVRPWAFAIARHCYQMHRRVFARKRQAEVSAESAGVELPVPTEMNGFADWESVREAMRALPLERREAVLLHYVWGFSYPEIARMLGIGTGAAKLRAFRGIQFLRERLGPNEKAIR